jgi:hypothetical protein
MLRDSKHSRRQKGIGKVIKHLIAGLILIMLATPAFSGDVQLVQSGGVYMVPVRINDAVVIPFVLDSGAAEVVIPADVFSVLLRSGTISQSDYKAQANIR